MDDRLCEALRKAGYKEDEVLGGIRRFQAFVPSDLDDFDKIAKIFGAAETARENPYDIIKHLGMTPAEDKVLIHVESQSCDDWDAYDWREYHVLVRD